MIILMLCTILDRLSKGCNCKAEHIQNRFLMLTINDELNYTVIWYFTKRPMNVHKYSERLRAAGCLIRVMGKFVARLASCTQNIKFSGWVVHVLWYMYQQFMYLWH